MIMTEAHPGGRTGRQGLVKINFPLDNQDAAMGVESENLWAEPVGENAYKIDNIPFYVYGISDEDVVSTVTVGDRLQFQRVLQRGGHSTYRVLITDPAGFESKGWKLRWEMMAILGCSYEVAKQRWIAIDVPKSSNADDVYSVLARGVTDGIWSIDEGHCGHPL